MKKLVFISDTHSSMHEIKIPECDILFHCGDATYRGGLQEMEGFIKHFTNNKAKERVFVAGNHDKGLSSMFPEEMRITLRDKLSKAGIIYLEHEARDVQGLKVFGSPYSPQFGEWGFQYLRGSDKWGDIPEGLDILITHGPPFSIMDKNHRNWPCGCEHLFNHVMKKQPRIHAFGHIHEGYGTHSFNNTRFINASCLDEMYDAVNQPIVVEYDEVERKVVDVYEANKES